MKIKNKLLSSLVSTIVVAIVCCVLAAPAFAAPKNKLNLYIWSEYIDPEIVSQFEEKFDCKVTIDLYEDNESMLAKLAGGGDSLYDLAVPSDYVIPVLAKRNLLQKIDKSKIPNFANLDPKFTNPAFDPKNDFSIPYQWGTVGIFMRGKPTEESWSLVFDAAKQKGPFVLIDSMREAIGSALFYKGYSPNETDTTKLKEAYQLLLDAKKRSIGMDGGVGGKNKVLAQVANLAIVYSGDGLRGMAEDEETTYFIPKEGSQLWIDSLVIPAKAPNKDMAEKFINYILDADVGAQLSNFNQYGTPNKASMPKITPEDLQNPAIYPNEEVMSKLKTLADLGADTKLYDELWTKIKS